MKIEKNAVKYYLNWVRKMMKPLFINIIIGDFVPMEYPPYIDYHEWWEDVTD